MLFLRLIIAFVIGGLLCAAVQLLIDYTKLTPARILTGLVVLGVLLGAIGIYEPFAKFAGAGATVPLIGFGSLLATGVRDEIDARGVVGLITGGYKAAAGGLGAALFFSMLAGILFKSKNE